MAYGFPRSKNKKYTSGQVSLQARSYSGCGAEPDAIPAFLRRSRPRHIFLEYDERTTEGEDGVRRNVSAPAGMSGGALIDMGVFSDPMISNPSTASAPLLSGVLLEFHRKHGLMIALDVQVVIEGIKRSAL